MTTGLPANVLKEVLAQWFKPGDINHLTIHEIAGGLSGAKLWRVKHDETSYCLRQWPIGCPSSANSLNRIHGVIQHVWDNGFRNVPLTIRTREGVTFVQSLECFWELAQWLPGTAATNLTTEHAYTAAGALAQFHRAAASYPIDGGGRETALEHRIELLENLRISGLTTLEQAIRNAMPSELRETAARVVLQIDALLPKALDAVRSTGKQLPVQWCLVDCHIENFLFVGNQVSGIVDFATARVGSVAQDLARLVGSVFSPDENQWRACLAAYQQRRQLSVDELRAVNTFYISGTIGTAANWLRWRFIEGRDFANAANTHQRLLILSKRLESLRSARPEQL